MMFLWLEFRISNSEASMLGGVSDVSGTCLINPVRVVHVTDVLVHFVRAATPEGLISFGLAARAAFHWTPENCLVVVVERLAMAFELGGSTECALEALWVRASQACLWSCSGSWVFPGGVKGKSSMLRAYRVNHLRSNRATYLAHGNAIIRITAGVWNLLGCTRGVARTTTSSVHHQTV
jgi:hypothetical protein